MRILFAVSSSENSKSDIVDVILNEYQKLYKEIISYKRAFYYDAIINEIKLAKENKYDRIIISEDLEKNISDSHDAEDQILYRHMDELTDEAYKEDGTGIPIILICNDRRSERDPIIKQLFTLGIYNVLTGKERTIQNVCALIDKPRNKKEAKIVYNLDPKGLQYQTETPQKKISDKELLSILKFFNINKGNIDKCVRGFAKLSREYTEEQLQIIINNLPLDVRIVLEENSKEYLKVAKVSVKKKYEEQNKNTFEARDLTNKSNMTSSDVIIPNQMNRKSIFKRKNGNQ